MDLKVKSKENDKYFYSGRGILDENRSIKYPVRPEISDPAIMPILAEFITSGFPAKARFAIKIDIVKPTPARKAMPVSCKWLTPKGISVSRIFRPSQVKNNMPIDFPANRLIIITSIME